MIWSQSSSFCIYAKVVVACFLVVMATPVDGTCQNGSSVLEITGFQPDISYSDDASWGWWNPAKYDFWAPENDEDIDLAEVKLILLGDKYQGVLNWERNPELQATGMSDMAQIDPAIVDALSAEIEVFDVGGAQPMALSNNLAITPFAGVSYILIDETKTRLSALDSPPPDRATSRLWGVHVGGQVDYVLSQRFSVSGRLIARWGRGKRTGSFTPFDAGGENTADQISLSDTTDRAMWGGDFGLRIHASDSIAGELGWRHRDWTFDDGPASFSGAYVRLSLRF